MRRFFSPSQLNKRKEWELFAITARRKCVRAAASSGMTQEEKEQERQRRNSGMTLEEKRQERRLRLNCFLVAVVEIRDHAAYIAGNS
jgi:hypothetical protein